MFTPYRLTQLFCSCPFLINLYESSGTRCHTNNPKLSDATKHIDIAYHFTRERVKDGTLTLLHIPSAENLADICTKGLPSPRLNHLCTCIFGTK